MKCYNLLVSDVDGGFWCSIDEMNRGYAADVVEFKQHGGNVLQLSYDNDSLYYCIALYFIYQPYIK